MSKGWIVAAGSDADAARVVAEGFGLAPLRLADFPDSASAVAHIAGADNIGVILSLSATRDAGFVAVVQLLGQQRANAQIILAEPEARDAFAFVPRDWPTMTLDEARHRADLASKRRAEVEQMPHAAPLPPMMHEEPPAPPQAIEETEPAAGGEAESETHEETPEDLSAAESDDGDVARAITIEPEDDTKDAASSEALADIEPEAGESARDRIERNLDRVYGESKEEPVPEAFGRMLDQMDEKPDELPPAAAPAPAPAAPAPAPMRGGAAASVPALALSAPADATAFAPKKLRRGTPELIRVVIHQPSDLKAVLKAAKKIDPTAEPGPQSMGLGNVALGSSIGVSLEVHGATCDGAVQRRTWQGEPIDFNFTAEADDGAKQSVIIGRVFVDDAQIGMIAFTRPISGPKKKAADIGDGARMKRFKRVFLSYSAKDRETVSRIATAYQAAGVDYFWDRTSLKSGEEWSPRLRKEIDKSDLFHLCWSKSAAASEWVEKEAEHALTRRKRSNGKQPAITVQMLDGPPWAPHPPSLDSINFDDFVRAAIVGYARGES